VAADKLSKPTPAWTPWTREELQLLGVLPDPEVAHRTGRTWIAVRTKRALLGIPPAGKTPRRRWSAKEHALVGRLPPAEVARRTGRTMLAVWLRRFSLWVGQRGRVPAAPQPLPPAWLFRDLGPAVRVLAWLAVEERDTFVSCEVLSPVAGVERKHLWGLLLSLTRAGLLHSWGGPAGGYHLARPVDDVSLLEIAVLVDGPIGGTVPKQVSGADPAIDRRLQAVCDATAGILRRNLGRVSVSDLVRRRSGAVADTQPDGTGGRRL
jgi:Rrf2 family protein